MLVSFTSFAMCIDPYYIFVLESETPLLSRDMSELDAIGWDAFPSSSVLRFPRGLIPFVLEGGSFSYFSSCAHRPCRLFVQKTDLALGLRGLIHGRSTMTSSTGCPDGIGGGTYFNRRTCSGPP